MSPAARYLAPRPPSDPFWRYRLASRAAALGGAALLVSIAVPAAAQAAPTIAAASPCVRYVGTKPPAPSLGVLTSGWGPNSPLSFSFAGVNVGSGTTDPTGAFNTGAAPFTPPKPKHNLQTVTLSAQDAAGNTATAQVKLVKLVVTVPKGRFKPSRRVKYRAFGFAPGKKLFLFVRRGGKTLKRVPLGRTKGACGLLTKKLPLMPLAHPKAGVYDFWYSHSKRYSKQTRIYRYKIQIFPA
jgi:hypothetical protein